ncbi:hypothetical protein LPJ60_005789, partial [Coemansia sp. RSA 2675]
GSDTDESTLIGVLSDAAASTPASDSSDAETIIVEPSPGETDEHPEDDRFGGIQLYLLGTGFSETNAYMLGRNESNEDIEPFNGTDLSDVNEHLLAINSMDSGAASDAGGDSNAESSGFNELYDFMRTAGSDSVLNPSPALPTAGPSTARPSTAVTQSSKHQRTGLTKGSSRAVLGSRLSYTLVMIGGMSADNMSGALLDIMFYEAINLRLRELHVITASEIKKMGSNEVCELVKGWLQRVAGVVADDGLATTLELADWCNN